MPEPKPNTEEQDQLFRLLRQVDLTPDATQRDMAGSLGLSLGRLNTLLRMATDSGLVEKTASDSKDRRQRVA